MAHPDELEGLVVLFASPASSFMTGTVHLVDGGSLVQV
jgi:NAD(P)-dependent dehydrogenase (short-subunit alcohol dehydrogenase family)